LSLHPGLSREQQQRIAELFEEAIDLPANRWRSFAGELAGEDRAIATELLSLLEAYERSSGFFERLSDRAISTAVAILDEPDVDDAPTASQNVLHYELIERIGGGGMGVVYKARDTRLGRIVALKFLPRRQAADSGARARLLAEARAASALDHPNIGVVYEIAHTEEDRPFIAMAWYDGETLKAKIRNERIAVQDAVAIARQLASALDAAHSAGIVHRDVKPANVIITRAGIPKLVDFGIAKLQSAADGESLAAAGTIAYMSPEQTRGGSLDARTDIWSLGVLLYEMLSGRRPFRGETDSELVSAIRNQEPESLAGLRGDAPAALVRLVETCLGKAPEERYQSAVGVIDALAAISTRRQARDDFRPADALSGSTPGLRKRFPLAGGLAILILAGTGAIAAYLNRDDPSPTPVIAPTEQTRSLAVLAFSNLDTTGADDHLASGFTDQLISTLGSTLDVNVSARASTMTMERRGIEPLAIGRQLGAEAVVDGSVQRNGSSIEVTARLVNVADGRILWTRDYHRTVTGAHEIQRDITSGVANAMRLARRQGAVVAAKPLTQDIGAYELYVKGRMAWAERTRPKLEEAIAYFRGALERDPQFAEVHAALGATYVNMSNFAWMSPTEAIARAGVSTSRAIALDSSLAEAHAAHGFVLASRGEYAASEAAFRKAIELNPSFAWTYHYYAMLLIMQERVDEAAENLRSSVELDPLSLPANATLAITEMMKGRKGEARRMFAHTLSLSPDFTVSLHYFGALMASDGQCSEAVAMLERAYRLSPRFPGVAATLAWCYSKSGRAVDARRIERDLSEGVRDERSRINLALAHAVLGRPDTAFAQLRSARWDVPTVIELRANPLLAAFRKDARYASLVPKNPKGP
jgi:serine/threonine protein kinase/tetratricopeptide (TPR) repeat protein